MTTARSRSWFAFCLAYMDMKWPAAAPKTRESLTDALATIIPAVTGERVPDWLDLAVLRRALRQFAPKPGKPGPGRPPGSKNRRPAPRHDVGKTTKRDLTLKARREHAG